MAHRRCRCMAVAAEPAEGPTHVRTRASSLQRLSDGATGHARGSVWANRLVETIGVPRPLCKHLPLVVMAHCAEASLSPPLQASQTIQHAQCRRCRHGISPQAAAGQFTRESLFQPLISDAPRPASFVLVTQQQLAAEAGRLAAVGLFVHLDRYEHMKCVDVGKSCFQNCYLVQVLGKGTVRDVFVAC